MKSIIAAVCSAASSIVLGLAPSLHAQALAERVPQDALVYVGWSGADAMSAEYDGSRLSAVMKESKARDLFGRYLNELEAMAVKHSPDAKEAFRLGRLFAAPLWKYPTAMFLGTPDFTDRANPKVHFAILCKAGADATKLGDALNGLIEKSHKGAVPLQAFVAGDIVCLAAGYESAEAALAGEGHSIREAKPFAEALKQVTAKPAVVRYVNAEAIAGLVEEAAARHDPETQTKVNAFLDASGLRAVKGYISASGFDGKDWVDQAFLSAPGEHTGVLEAVPAGAVDGSLLKVVPADATFFLSSRFDPAKFIRATQAALGKTDEDALKYFNMGLSGLQQAAGTNVLDNLLEPLGSDWVIYDSPRVGSGLLGMVGVNKLDDPEKFRKAMRTASVNLTNWLNIAMSKKAPQSGLTIHGATTKIGDVDVNYLALPIVAPAWAISDGKLFLGMYPQTVGAALRQAAKNEPSIVDSPKYQAVMKRLGTPAGTSSYYDLPTSAMYGPMYGQMMALFRYAGFGDLYGVTLPEPLLPPMDALLDQLTPAGSASWVDELGFHTKAITPFPGAALVSEQGAVATIGAGSGALMTSILLPAVNKAREAANRVKSANNLRQIGTGTVLFANENGGKYPPDIATLLHTQDLVGDVFINPRTGNDIPAEARKNVDATIDYVADHSDYVYIGNGLDTTSDAETIVAYEKPDGLSDGINMLFADGHVEFRLMEPALAEIAAQKKKRGID